MSPGYNPVSTAFDPPPWATTTTPESPRLLFTRGFFRIRNLAISVNPVPGEIHIPYWVGFRGRGSSANFAVIDAVRRQPEGARVRRMLEEWLSTNTDPSTMTPLPSIF